MFYDFISHLFFLRNWHPRRSTRKTPPSFKRSFIWWDLRKITTSKTR